jgi:hypothetical protein
MAINHTLKGSASIYLLILFSIIGVQFSFLQRQIYLKAKINSSTSSLVKRNSELTNESINLLNSSLTTKSITKNTSGKFGQISKISLSIDRQKGHLLFSQNKMPQINWRLLEVTLPAYPHENSLLIPKLSISNLRLTDSQIFQADSVILSNTSNIYSSVEKMIIASLGEIVINQLTVSWDMNLIDIDKYIHIISEKNLTINHLETSSFYSKKKSHLILYSQNGEVRLPNINTVQGCKCSPTNSLSCLYISTDLPPISIKKLMNTKNNICLNPIFSEFNERDEVLGTHFR